MKLLIEKKPVFLHPMFKKLVFAWFLVAAVGLSSCSKHQRMLKSTDYNAKLEAAEKYYEKGDYFRALQLYEELVVVFRGTEKAEKIYYHYAQAHFKMDDYILASYHFKYFARTFPKSEFTEECLFLAAYCKYLDSPNHSLDQTNTIEALQEIQLFINMYPTSTRMKEYNEIVDKLRFTLQSKDFEIAMLYLNIQDYKAAIYSLNTFLKEHPASTYREQVMYNLVKANFLLAGKSIESKRRERYIASIEAYEKFSASFPASRYLKDAASYHKQAQKLVSDLIN
jgi:outer membrane protein assembly factor BamD